MNVSIIFVNYKTAKLVINAIDSVIKMTNSLEYEIIVVDNSEDKNELEILKSNLSGKALVIDSQGNKGFGTANNLGAKYSKGDCLFFLNSDTILMNNAIFELYDFLIKHDDVGIVGSNLYSVSGTANHSFILNEKNIRNEKKETSLINLLFSKIRKKRKDFNYTNTPLSINGYVCGAALMIKRSVFDFVNGFNEEIFMYAEEALLCYEVMHKMNLKIYNVPSSRIIHFEGASFENKLSINKIKSFIDGNCIYYKKAFDSQEEIKYLNLMMRQSKFKRLIYMTVKHNKDKANYFKFVYNYSLEKIKKCS